MHRQYNEKGELIAEFAGTEPRHQGAFSADGRPLDGPSRLAESERSVLTPAAEPQLVVNEESDKTDSRLETIMAAIVKLTDNYDQKDWAADGRPRVDAIEKLTGFGITSAERDNAWSLINEED